MSVPPEIESGPTEVAESVNDQTILQCETSGQPTPVVSWTKDGKPFPATGLRHRMLPSGSLEFMIVRLEDDGVYQCTATNAAGNASHTVQLKVQSECFLHFCVCVCTSFCHSQLLAFYEYVEANILLLKRV